MINDFTFLYLFAPKSEDMQHGHLILRFLIAGKVLDNRLHSAIDGDGYRITGLNNLFDHIVRIGLQVTDWQDIGKTHIVALMLLRSP